MVLKPVLEPAGPPAGVSSNALFDDAPPVAVLLLWPTLEGPPKGSVSVEHTNNQNAFVFDKIDQPVGADDELAEARQFWITELVTTIRV